MENEKAKRIHLIYGCILSVLLVAVGIALIVSCLDIYNSGPRPYSPQSIGEHFKIIAIPVFVTIAAILGGIVLDLVVPCEKKRPKAMRDEKEALVRMHKRAGILKGDFAAQAKKQQDLRKWLTVGTAVLYALLMIPPVIYFTNSANFTVENLNGDIIRSLILALGYSLIGLVATFICKTLCRKSMDKEMAICKQAIAAGETMAAEPVQPDALKEKRQLFAIRAVILVVAIVFIIVGIFNGGADDVLDKAVKICTECIGLG